MGRPVERKSDGELERHNNTAATVNFLLNYEFYDGERKDRPIVVIGPAAGSRVTMLRAYAYGGLIGQIATRRADFSHLAHRLTVPAGRGFCLFGGGSVTVCTRYYKSDTRGRYFSYR